MLTAAHPARVLVKKAHRLEGKAAVGHGHHRPVFGAGDVVVAKDVPEHHIGVVEVAIALRPFRQSLPAGVLIGVRTCREILVGVVGGDPEVMVQEPGPFADGRVGVGKGADIVPWHQLEAH
jgi:hypothetical protein